LPCCSFIFAFKKFLTSHSRRLLLIPFEKPDGDINEYFEKEILNIHTHFKKNHVQICLYQSFLYCIFQYQFNIFNGKYVYDLNIVLAM